MTQLASKYANVLRLSVVISSALERLFKITYTLYDIF